MIEEKELNYNIGQIVRNLQDQLANAERRIIFQDIITIYESGATGKLTYGEYKKQVMEHNAKAVEKNNPVFIPSECNVVFEYMPKRALLTQDDFDYIRGLSNVNLIEKYKNKRR